MTDTGYELIRRLLARLRRTRALRHERAMAPGHSLWRLHPDPPSRDVSDAAALAALMDGTDLAVPEELRRLARGRYISNGDLSRLVTGLEQLDAALEPDNDE